MSRNFCIGYLIGFAATWLVYLTYLAATNL